MGSKFWQLSWGGLPDFSVTPQRNAAFYRKKETRHMAKDKTTDLATRTETQVAGTYDLGEFEKLIGEGFASIESVLLGDPADGKQPVYIGQLIGPGSPIEMDPDPKTGEVRVMKTFAFHPMTRTDDGRTGPALNVTHVIPSSFIVANACERIQAQAERDGKTAVVAFLYGGKRKTRKGYQVNDFRVFEKYV
jgi:hypothetical protein